MEGDNPSYNYYEIGDTGVRVAVLAMFTWDYPCGGCHKMRISPQGLATICISQKNPPVLWGMSYDEKLATIKQLTDYRESEQFEVDFRTDVTTGRSSASFASTVWSASRRRSSTSGTSSPAIGRSRPN